VDFGHATILKQKFSEFVVLMWPFCNSPFAFPLVHCHTLVLSLREAVRDIPVLVHDPVHGVSTAPLSDPVWGPLKTERRLNFASF
jgi:hypothetical protein